MHKALDVMACIVTHVHRKSNTLSFWRQIIAENALPAQDFRCIARNQPLPSPNGAEEFGYEEGSFPTSYDLFCVCDGHNGKDAGELRAVRLATAVHPPTASPLLHLRPSNASPAPLLAPAARFFTEHIASSIAHRVPRGAPPPLGSRDASQWMAAFRGALVDAILQLEEHFARVAETSGCTVSLALLVGRWLMVGNVGDSSVVLDTGLSWEQLNVDHRLEDNVREQERIVQVRREAPMRLRCLWRLVVFVVPCGLL